MRKVILILLFVAIAISCQTLDGGGEIKVSGKEFIVDGTGGDVDITTGGAVNCTLTEPDKDAGDFIRLDLHNTQPVTYDGSWYSFESKNDGKEMHLTFEANSTSSDRVLYLTLTEADLYTRITITQSGSK